MRPLRLLPIAFTCLVIAPLFAQAQDAPPIDTAALLKELHRIRDAQTVTSKQARTAALQQIASAATSPERAVALWEEAVRAVQFDGAPKENAAFRDWKDKDGEALSGPLARNAVRLYFVWLGLTIQRDADVPIKDLMPHVVAYTKELIADEHATEALEDSIKREKEQGGNKRPGPQRKATDDQVKKMHDQILRRPLSASPVVQWMKITDFINPEKWEKQPGNLDGIYTQIILPELRAMRDPRVLEYWELKLKKETDAVSKSKLAFDIEKFNTQRRPALIWSRAEDMLLIGQKNRAMGEMFTLIRNNPQHPEAAAWIGRLEAILTPSAADSPASSATPPPPGSAQPLMPGAAQPAPSVVK